MSVRLARARRCRPRPARSSGRCSLPTRIRSLRSSPDPPPAGGASTPRGHARWSSIARRSAVDGEIGGKAILRRRQTSGGRALGPNVLLWIASIEAAGTRTASRHR
jgi:hypothetical protein